MKKIRQNQIYMDEFGDIYIIQEDWGYGSDYYTVMDYGKNNRINQYTYHSDEISEWYYIGEL